MALPNIDKLNRKQLLELQSEIDQRLKELEVESKKEALEKIQAIADEEGFTVEEILESKRKRTPAKPKYKDPESGKTWTGKGRKPKGMPEGEEEREAFLI